MTVRRAVVVGAGGVLGAAWNIGALMALEEVLGIDAREADLVVGTSAGSVLAALIGAGVPAGALRDHQRGLALPTGLRIEFDHDTGTGGAVPVRPRLRPAELAPGSLPLVRRGALHPRRIRPLVTLTALLPRGRSTLGPLTTAVASVAPGEAWPRPVSPDSGLWIVALDYATGLRTVFGRPDAPATSLPQAVTASCSIPGWYAPTVIAGREFVDGGPMSSTSTDLLAGLGFDEVVVLAPTASFRYDRPAQLGARLERRWRRRVTANLVREVRLVEAQGTAVTVMTPGPADLAAIGSNLMDPARRRDVLETSLATSSEALRRSAARRSS